MLKHNNLPPPPISSCWKVCFTLFSAPYQRIWMWCPVSGRSDGSLYVRKAVEFIQTNYANPIRVTDIADYVCINRSYQ